LDTSELKQQVEGLLFAADEPVTLERLSEVLEVDKREIEPLLWELADDYRNQKRGFSLEKVAQGVQLRSLPEHAEAIRRLQGARPFRFSRAALETLAIIAYRQPVTRAEIEYLRGVDSGGVLKTLLDKRLLRILGKKDLPGRPLLYGTSRGFLEFFGLENLSELPSLREFSDVQGETIFLDGMGPHDAP